MEKEEMVMSSENMRSSLRRDLYDKLDFRNKHLKGKLLTLIESFGGDKDTVKSRKDMLHLILAQEFDYQGETIGHCMDQFNVWMKSYIEQEGLEEKKITPPKESYRFSNVNKL